ncbi:unnamed protein product [Effrenium voratum]|uniref:Guanylate cyclase domain-containing protein n=1 Tax=Effrenium voratum TaxID=2562239 RepID=A0AA36MMX6_9DINO|nr:unnamed protein product [Effrenium voratum]
MRCSCFDGFLRAEAAPLAPPPPTPPPSLAQSPTEADAQVPRGRRKSRTYSKMSSFVPEEPDDLDDIADMWRYYAFVAEKQVQTATGRMVENQLPESESSSAPPVLTPTRRSVIRGPQLLQNSLLQYLSHTVSDAIEQGIISKEDFPQAMGKRGEYNPSKGHFQAAVVFADASGFTALTEALAKQPHGAQELGGCLNGFFGALIDIITRHGGDVLKFSGDALTILWRVAPGDESDEARRAAVFSACCCCEEVQRGAQSFGQTPMPDIRLTLHIGVGFGPLKLLQLGGLLDRWEFCAAGQPLEEVAIAEPLAKPGETVVSPSVRELLQGSSFFGFQALPSSDYALLVPKSQPPGKELRNPKRRPNLDGLVVQRYVPQAAKRLLSQQSESLILGLEPEMRRVSVIFLSIRGLDPGRAEEDGGRTQQLVQLLQASCYAFEGSVNKFLVDDKGMLLLCAFGLPPLNHYLDDPLRAVLAAARFCDTLAEEGLDGRAGVATGTVWCGTVGNTTRREYTVLGDTVNLSARLMARTERNTVLVDGASFRSCKSTLAFENLGAIKVKGKKDQVEVYRFTGQLLPRRDRERKGLQTSLLSWEEWPAREELIAALDLQLQNSGGLVVVHGGPGCGKTELAAHVRAWALEQNLAVLSGQNQSPTGTLSVPRLCWQEVFAALLKEAKSDPFWNPRAGAANDRQILRKLLTAAGADNEIMAWLPVLRLFFPQLYFGPNVVNAMVERDNLHATTRPLRVVTLCKMLIDAFSTHSTKSQGVVVLLHLRRSTSFFGQSGDYDENIVDGIAQLCQHRGDRKPLIFCVVTREAALPSKALLPAARDVQGEVQVSNLSSDMTELYVQHMVKAEGLDPDLLQYIYESSGGNPSGVEIVVSELRKSSRIQVREGRLELMEGMRLRREYPEALIGIALAAFEQLKPLQQDLVKNIAMCSQEADAEVLNLEDLAEALEWDFDQLQQDCARLVTQGVFRPVMPLPKRMTRRNLASGSQSSLTFTPSAGNSPARGARRLPSDMELCAISFGSQLLRHVAPSPARCSPFVGAAFADRADPKQTA